MDVSKPRVRKTYGAQLIELHALGKPWRLGNLYDAVNQQLIKGQSMWNLKKENIHTQDIKYISSKMKTQETLDSRAEQLKIDGDLTLGILSGLIEVSGSANYIRTSNASSNKARLSYYCFAKTISEEIINIGEPPVINPEIISRLNATHVCVCIEYGGNCVLDFQSEVHRNEKISDVEGRLKAAVNKIPIVMVEVEAGVKADEEIKNEYSKIECSYEGDIKPSTPVIDFQSAIRAVQEIYTGMILSSSKPVKVYLVPLSLIFDSIKSFSLELDNSMIDEFNTIIGALKSATDTLDELCSDETVKQFKNLSRNLNNAKLHIQKRKKDICKAVKDYFPKYRSGDEEAYEKLDSELTDLLVSAYNPDFLNTWIESKKTFTVFLSDFLRGTIIQNENEDITLCTSEDEIELLKNRRDIKGILIFSLKIFGQKDDPYVNHMKENSSLDQEYDLERLVFKVDENLRSSRNEFLDFVEVNSGNELAPKFVILLEESYSKNNEYMTDTLNGSISYLNMISDPYRKVDKVFLPKPPKHIKVLDIGESHFILDWGSADIDLYFEHEIQYRRKVFGTLIPKNSPENVLEGTWMNEIIGRHVQIVDEDSPWNNQFGKILDKKSDSKSFLVQIDPVNGSQFNIEEPKVFSISKLIADKRENEFETKLIQKGSSGVLLEELESYLTYEVRIRQRCSFGYSKFTKSMFIKTARHSDDEINLLLLGETGVGKSTFINAFRNYITYENIKTAIAGGLLPVMPAAFTVTDMNNEQKIVEVSGINEQTSEKDDMKEDITNTIQGASCTQSCRSYVFDIPTSQQNIGQKKVRIIDTPGIGDTRGVEQDKANCQHIFDFIGEYAKIHAILVLMKPNETRLKTSFRYSILELLQHLHISASRNILFVFTNSRQTFYAPGETINPLKTLLNELEKNPPFVCIKAIPTGQYKTLFCLDSEGWRYVAAKEKGIELSEAKDEDFKASWEKSSGCCREILTRAKRITPHNTKETVSLNEARRQALSLREPIAVIIVEIEKNLELIKIQEKEVKDQNATKETLQKNLTVKKRTVVAKKLDKPTTVCLDCVEWILDETTGDKKRVFTSKCHEGCNLSNIEVHKYPNEELIKCAAMIGYDRNAYCSVCTHSWMTHMHTTLDYSTKITRVKDENAIKRFNAAKSLQDEKKVVLDNLKTKTSEWEEELAVVRKVIAKCACFLATCGIVPINNAFESYIESEIKTLEHKKANEDTVSRESTAKLIEKLKKQLKAHKKEAQWFRERQTENDSEVVQPEDISMMKKELFALPHFGKTIEESCQEFDKAHTKMKVSPGGNDVYISNKTQRRSRRKPKQKISKIQKVAANSDSSSQVSFKLGFFGW